MTDDQQQPTTPGEDVEAHVKKMRLQRDEDAPADKPTSADLEEDGDDDVEAHRMPNR